MLFISWAKTKSHINENTEARALFKVRILRIFSDGIKTSFSFASTFLFIFY